MTVISFPLQCSNTTHRKQHRRWGWPHRCTPGSLRCLYFDLEEPFTHGRLRDWKSETPYLLGSLSTPFTSLSASPHGPLSNPQFLDFLLCHNLHFHSYKNRKPLNPSLPFLLLTTTTTTPLLSSPAFFCSQSHLINILGLHLLDSLLPNQAWLIVIGRSRKRETKKRSRSIRGLWGCRHRDIEKRLWGWRYNAMYAKGLRPWWYAARMRQLSAPSVMSKSMAPTCLLASTSDYCFTSSPIASSPAAISAK